jgi:hypothetical protein
MVSQKLEFDINTFECNDSSFQSDKEEYFRQICGKI